MKIDYWLMLVSFALVAFGQPAWINAFGILASSVGYGLFLFALSRQKLIKQQLILAASWYTSVQVVQLSWFISHPFAYAYIVLLLLAWLMASQWAFFSYLTLKTNLNHFLAPTALAGVWTLFEWSRLFFFSGFPFNPVGLNLSSTLYGMQLAAVGGVYLLSFWVILTNLYFYKFLKKRVDKLTLLIWVVLAIFPYVFGYARVYYYESLDRQFDSYKVLLVQPVFPVNEGIKINHVIELEQSILHRWEKIFQLTSQAGTNPDLIVLPENAVPYGAYGLTVSLDRAQSLSEKYFGQSKEFMPQNLGLYSDIVLDNNKRKHLVNNAFFAQFLANFYNSALIIGLENQVFHNNQVVFESSALFFSPKEKKYPNELSYYSKRILVPMGEYIPFSWCKSLAAKYGVHGSFEPGSQAVLFNGPVPIGPSICYEEIFGDLVRESCLLGAELLVNITNDGWYPHSKLPRQHFDHARLRAVENGVSLVRACNTGVTGLVDYLGRVKERWGSDSVQEQEEPAALLVNVSKAKASTLYTLVGDRLIIYLSILFLGMFVLARIYDIFG